MDPYTICWFLLSRNSLFFEGVNRLQSDGKTLYFGPDMSVRAVVQAQGSNCNITELQTTYRTIYYAMGFQKHSEFTQLFNHYIGR